ncbi:MAG: HTH domain-containing protein [Pseudomonadota bacterium]
MHYESIAAKRPHLSENPDAAYIRQHRQCKHYYNISVAEFFRLHHNPNLKLSHIGLASFLMVLAHDSPNQSVICAINDLAAHFRVTRQTIRRYIRALEAEGHLYCHISRRTNTTEFHIRAPQSLRTTWAEEANRRGKEHIAVAPVTTTTAVSPHVEPVVVVEKAIEVSTAPTPALTPVVQKIQTTKPISTSAPASAAAPTPAPAPTVQVSAAFGGNDFSCMPTCVVGAPMPNYLSEAADTVVRLRDSKGYIHNIPVCLLVERAMAVQYRRNAFTRIHGADGFRNPDLSQKVAQGYTAEEYALGKACYEWVLSQKQDALERERIEKTLSTKSVSVTPVTAIEVSAVVESATTSPIQAANQTQCASASPSSPETPSAPYIKPDAKLPTGEALKELVTQTLKRMRDERNMGAALCEKPIETLVQEVLFMMHAKPNGKSRATTPEARWAMAQSLCLSGKWQTPEAFLVHDAKVREAAWTAQKKAELNGYRATG